MSIGKVEICGVNTSKLIVMPEKEKIELLKKVREGDSDARNSLVNGNLRLVLSVIRRFIGRGEAPDDLFQVGCIGLIKAIDNFDLSLDVRFSTYAVPMILGELKRHLRDNNPVRVSRSLRDLAYRAMAEKERLQRMHSCEPTISEIAKELDVEPSQVAAALESVVEPVSLYEPIYSDNGDNMYVMDIMSEDTSEDNWLCEISFREAVMTLKDRERQILRLRFLEGKTQVEVARRIGISQAQVSRLEKTALTAIKQGFKPS